jgi:hypothetical protein
LKELINKALVFIGRTAFLILLAWSIIGVWAFSFKAIKLMLLMIDTGLPAYNQVTEHTYLIGLFGLAAYYLFYSKSISNIFWSFPIAKPIIVMGLSFFVGLTITNYIIFYICIALEPTTAQLYILAATGVILTRVLMSQFFKHYPAEWFASR